MFAIKADLKTKGSVLGNGPLLHWAFMKFRGPQALKELTDGMLEALPEPFTIPLREIPQ